MDGITNKNQLAIVKEYEYDSPDINEIDSILDYVIKDCRNKYFHTFEYKLIYNLKLLNISNHDQVNLSITHKSSEFKT